MSWTRILGSATLLAFVLSLTVGSVESAIPNPTNKKFYACMNKRTRIIKMLNYPKVKSCPKRHKRISWNAKGNPGVPGPAGPAGPADWNAIPNKPAGFADGVDHVGGPGYVSSVQPTTHSLGSDPAKWIWVDAPVGVDVEITIIPTTGEIEILRRSFERRDGTTLRRYYEVERITSAPVEFKVRTRVFSEGIAPAALKKMAKKVKVKVTKKKPRR